eukprot:6295710-Alexandrium_andersonii.AAC.1
MFGKRWRYPVRSVRFATRLGRNSVYVPSGTSQVTGVANFDQRVRRACGCSAPWLRWQCSFNHRALYHPQFFATPRSE